MSPDGKEVRAPCDPTKLAGGAGGSLDGPRYTTLVYFRKDVLHRYYEEPDKYMITDGVLTCGTLWSLDIDNSHEDSVVALLGDLGTALPSTERAYWKAFNHTPDTPPSRAAVGRWIMGEFMNPEAPDLIFRTSYSRFNAEWERHLGWRLFNELAPGDTHILQRLRVPLRETLPELEGFALNLARLLIDQLDDRGLRERIRLEIPTGAKSLAKLDLWLRQEHYSEVDRDLALLQRLQRLRSRIAAHAKGSDFEDVVRSSLGESSFREGAAVFLRDATSFLQGLATHFGVAMHDGERETG